MLDISCYSLVDITETGVIRDHAGQELERNQQRNWETVLQCIGLRAQPMNIRQLAMPIQSAELAGYQFGEMYKGQHKVWCFKFSVEHEGVFEKVGDPLGLLTDSFDNVPVITYLTESARFLLPIFYTSGPIKNIYFKISPN
jgi:hypothetical protein